jgi:hypothetical protein
MATEPRSSTGAEREGRGFPRRNPPGTVPSREGGGLLTMRRRDFVRTAAAGAAAFAAGSPAARSQGAGKQRERAVLEGVECIGWGRTACLCFVGSVEATMRYIGEEVTTDYMMGISGGAFKILWGMPWCPANCDILLMGDEPIERTFAHLGYDYTRFANHTGEDPDATKELWRREIISSIDKSVPAIIQGPVGPPECSVVAGYDRGGEVLYGWSYFQKDHSEYFQSSDWFEKSVGLIVVGRKNAEPAPNQVLRGSLDWAIKLARTPQFEWEQEGPLLSGLAAYDAFARALERDEEFPPESPDLLEVRWYAIANDGAYLMTCKRNMAAKFLNGLPGWDFPCPLELLQAADAYQQVSDTWGEVCKLLPGDKSPEDKWRKLCDRVLRREMARLVREARTYEEQAVAYLEQAYRLLPAEDV